MVYYAICSREGGRLRCSPLVPRRKAAAVAHLVGSIHKVHWDAEGQWVVVGISQQDGHNLHPWGLGFSLTSLHSAVHWSLAVDGILAYFTPKQWDGDKSQTYALSVPCPHIHFRAVTKHSSSIFCSSKDTYLCRYPSSFQQTNSSSEKLQNKPELHTSVKLR